VLTYNENCNERPLEEPHQHIAPVVLIIGHAGVTDIHSKGHQEELDGWPQKTGPFRIQSGLDIELGEKKDLLRRNNKSK